MGAIKNKTIIRVLEWMELFAYRKADRIVPVTDAFKRYMVGKGIAPDKIEVIKNGVDLSFYQPSAKDNSLSEELGLQGKFIAAYFGTHGMAHHLETVLEAAKELERYPDIVFLLVGDGAERERLVKLKEEMGLNNVLMLGQQPKEKMPLLWALSAVSLVLLKKSDLFKTVLPSKIFESLGMGKPVILGVEGEARDIIEAANAGVCIEPENSHALAESVLMLYHTPSLGQGLGENGKRYVTTHFDRAVLARRMLSLLEGVGAQWVHCKNNRLTETKEKKL